MVQFPGCFLHIKRWLARSIAVAPLMLVSCQSSASRLVYLNQVQAEPIVRVRISAGQHQATIGGGALLRIEADGQHLGKLRSPVSVRLPATVRGLKLDLASGHTIHADSRLLSFSAAAVDQAMEVNGVAYPGTIHLKLRPGGVTFDIINHVHVERYLPGVLARELYRHWHPATYQAQAIAARSFAIAQLALSPNRAFDLEASQASQVYGGLTANPTARDAVRRTRGTVLAYREAVVPAYYCSCTGGVGQDAVIAFTDAVDIAPLRGRFHGSWGQASQRFRWGPFARDRAALARRLRSWGRLNRHPIAHLKDIAQIKASGYNAVGRVAEYTVYDAQGAAYDMRPETFRFACNHEDNGLPELTAANRLYSGHVSVSAFDQSVYFADGRGFGHGVGLGQFGAEAMAQRGYAAAQILAFFYPGAGLVKAYD